MKAPLTDQVQVSFEFFPPHSEQMQETLWNSIQRLKSFAPAFVSVTYGADGSTRERTHEVVQRIVSEADKIVAMAEGLRSDSCAVIRRRARGSTSLRPAATTMRAISSRD